MRLSACFVVTFLLFLPNFALSQSTGFVPVKTERDAKIITGTNVPPVFVYSSGDALNPGTEAPLATCSPENVVVKGPSGEDIVTQTICEKVLVATNPDKQFTVSGICSAALPSEMDGNCVATNKSVAWTNVAMSVTPRLDNQPVSNWPSIFCFGCNWQWVQNSNSCTTSITSASSRDLAHNFAGNPTGSCSSVGVFRVTDPETGKSWNSATINATLRPTPIVRNHVLTNTISVGPNDELYGSTNSQAMDSIASITFSPRLDGLSSGSWPNAPIHCPACVYSHTITSNSCQSVSVSGGNTVASHNVDTNGSCSFNLVMTVTDPETLWSTRLPATGSYSVTLRKKPPTCIPENQRRWVDRSESCSAGFSGSITYQMEQSRDFVCPTPYSVGSWSGWADTGSTRFYSNTCAANCVPDAPEERWTPQSQACPSGQLGNITWESQERRTSSCPGITGSPTWGSWQATGATRNTVNNCTASCSPLAPEIRWVSAGQSCPSGQTGSHTWEAEQRRTSSCPSPSSSPQWSDWSNTGATRNVVNTCTVPPPVCSPSSQQQWVSRSSSCPSGQTGSISWQQSQTRHFTCPAAQWGPWQDDAGVTQSSVNTCTASAPDIIDSFTAGCLVDTAAWDTATANSCGAGGPVRTPGQDAVIVFSVGDVIIHNEHFHPSTGLSNFTFTWSGGCSPTGAQCFFRLTCPSGMQRCEGLGARSATVTVRNNSTGKTRTFSISANDSTFAPPAGGSGEMEL